MRFAEKRCRRRASTFSHAGPRSRLWPTEWNLARKLILLNRKARRLPTTEPTGAANGGVPCCEDCADTEMTCSPWLVRAMCCMMHDESAREMARVGDALDRIDRIVGVPCCCSSMLIRDSKLHIWMSTFGTRQWLDLGQLRGRWGTHCTVADLQRGGGGKTVASG